MGQEDIYHQWGSDYISRILVKRKYHGSYD